jgi:hypothetical protein
MAIERIGYRRLYDAMGCSLTTGPEARWQFTFANGLHAEVYLGPRPRFGIQIDQSDRYFIPEQRCLLLRSEHHKDPSTSGYPRSFFTEVSCLRESDVPEAVSADFWARKPGAEKPLIALANQHIKEFKAAADLIAGTIGLRFHRQFVLLLLNENVVALLDDGDYAFETVGSPVELLESLSLNPTGVEALNGLLPGLASGGQPLPSPGSAVRWWLMRAWAERDPVSQFTALFVPLEMILQGVKVADAGDAERRAEAIRQLIAVHGGEMKEELLKFFEHLAKLRGPSLNERFRHMAQGFAMPGWEQDAEAFAKFNRTRNLLLHRGEPSVELIVDVSEEEVRQLEDLVERYVCFALFGDAAVYQTRNRWAKRPTPPASVAQGEQAPRADAAK